MIDALISGKLIKDCPIKTTQNDKFYTNFLLSVSVGEADNIVVSGIAFGATAERVGQLKKGDALCVSGALKPTEWEDKATGEARHGLSVTVSSVLSVYDIQKRRKKPETATVSTKDGTADKPFDDDIEF